MRGLAFTVSLLVATFGSALAQDPTDACGAGVQLLPVNSSCVATAYTLPGTYANGGVVISSCAGGNDRDDGWYRFVATSTSTTVQVSGNFARAVSVFTGSCGTGELGCSAQVAGTTASVTVATVIGTTYYIQVHRRSGTNTDNMTGTVCVFEAGGCATNGTIASVPFSATGQTTCGAGDDFSSSDACGSSYMNGDDFVYTFTPSSNVCVSISLSNTDTWVGLFVTDACPNGGSANCVASNTNSGGNPSVSGVNLTAGTTYYITISTYPAPQCTPFDISMVACPPPPANDECSGAFPVTVGAYNGGCVSVVAGTVNNATGSSQNTASCAGTENDDVWFSFVAPASGGVDISLLNVAGSTTDLYHSVWSGTCPTLTLVAGTCSDPNTSNVTGLTPGATYYLRVNSYGSGSETTTFNVCIENGVCPTPPSNNDCSGASPVTVGANGGGCVSTVSGTVSCASASSQSAASCGGTEDDDVWFSFVAPASGEVDISLINVAGSTTDLYHSVWSGTCPTLTLVAGTCSDPNTSSVAGLTPGVTYFLRVYSWGSSEETTTFNVCIENGACASAPSNNDCAGATAVPVGLNGGGCTTAVSGTVNCASASSQSAASCGGTEDDDVWFSFVAPASGQVDISILNAAGSTTDMYHSVWSGTCPTLALVAGTCSDADLSSVTGLTPGATYYIRVYTWTGTAGQTTTFDVCVEDGVCSLGSSTCGLNYTVSNIGYSPVSYATGTAISFVDDRLSAEIPIGFTFCFDGIGYNSLFISSNGFVVFPGCLSDVGGSVPSANLYSGWSISGPIPNTTNAPRNAILGPWHDVDPGVSGNVRYQVSGTAPNRIFTVKFDNVAMFSASCNSILFTGQIKLFETTNNIEIHIGQKNVCASWNSGQAILGLHNYNGTIARVPAGTNAPAQWTAANQAVRFTNNCGACTIILPVELLDFTATGKDEGNLVNWKIASETDFSHYVIEHSVDGETFKQMGTSPAIGNPTGTTEYSFLHSDPANGINYYRLQMVDINGDKRASHVVSVNNQTTLMDWQVFPNPVGNTLNVYYQYDGKQEVSFRIRDIAGRTLLTIPYQQTDGYNAVEIPVDGLTTGIYFVELYSTKLNAVVASEKIIKE
jgi:hypothetical protein